MIKENISEPIDWTTEEQQPSVTVYHRLEVLRESGLGISRVRATPADLISALAAMPAEERAEVLQAFMDPELRVYALTDCAVATARAEKAERERDKAADRADRFAKIAEEKRHEMLKMLAERNDARHELAQVAAERDEWRARAEKAEQALVGVAMQHSRELKELERVIDEERARAEKAERERDAARKELEEVQRNVARYVKSF